MILLGDIQNEVFDYEYIEKYQHYPKMAIAHRISSLGLESTANRKVCWELQQHLLPSLLLH